MISCHEITLYVTISNEITQRDGKSTHLSEIEWFPITLSSILIANWIPEYIRSGRSWTRIYLRPGRSGLEAPGSNPVPPGRVQSDLLPGLEQTDSHY